MEQEKIQQIISHIQSSKKYHSLNVATIQRIVQDTARRFPEKQIEIEAKKKLHQIWGAYYSSRPDFQKLETKIKEQLSEGKDSKEILLTLLKIHASTTERVPILEDFYKKIFAITGTPTSILDHASGINALTLPWMLLPATTIYRARDIDAEEVLFINNVFRIIGENNRASASIGDLFDEVDSQEAEVHFLFKILPLLEQQQKGSSNEILKKLNGKYIVVSYPIASLSGATKGMIQTYTAQCDEIIAAEHWRSTKLEFSTELVYIIEKI
jgi:16S rRNA (guanine(1405)-N(7))-methyltransferase